MLLYLSCAGLYQAISQARQWAKIGEYTRCTVFSLSQSRTDRSLLTFDFYAVTLDMFSTINAMASYCNKCVVCVITDMFSSLFASHPITTVIDVYTARRNILISYMDAPYVMTDNSTDSMNAKYQILITAGVARLESVFQNIGSESCTLMSL